MGDERTAEEVFRLLSDGTRLDVLRAVAVEQRERRHSGVAELSFSELYERVDVDSTSKLSYHLGELEGTFLRSNEGGYSFTHAGEQIVRFVLSGNFRSPPDVGVVETAGRCLFCGEAGLEATLQGQFFVVRCPACERPAFTYRVRPAQARSREGETLVDAVVREQAADFLKMRGGVCPDCSGRVDTAVIDVEGTPLPEALPVSFGTDTECRECLRQLSVPLPHAAAYHPESIAFHWEHGVDVVGTGVWEFHRYLVDGRWASERVAGDPAEYRVDLECADETLRLYLDDTAAVTRTERVRRRDHRDRDS